MAFECARYIKMQLLIAHCATKTIRDRKMAAIIRAQLSCEQLVCLPNIFKVNCAKHMALTLTHTQTHVLVAQVWSVEKQLASQIALGGNIQTKCETVGKSLTKLSIG